MSAKVKWNGKMAFTGSAGSGFSLPLDADARVGGEAGGFRPMELLAVGLAGCTAMDVISILSKKRQDVTDFEVVVHTDRAENHPKVFTHAVIEYTITGHNIDEAAVVRAIELSATVYCPAQAMFNQLMPIELLYRIYEDGVEGQPELVTSGEYRLPDQVAS